MKKNVALFLVLCSLHSSLFAQIDSSWLDLGRIKLKKDFTQTITIKGKDLEQMPFASLDEAINVWLFGIATNRQSVAYVIDGNLLTDVNAYTIHDIEEITLVQNALVQLNGAVKEKQLILVTTKKNKSGISIAGSSFAVKNKIWYSHDYNFESETNYFHRYDISARRNTERMQYGITAGFLRDVLPYAGNAYTNVRAPFQVNRFRFNGYFNASINANNNVWLRAGYVPGTYKYDYTLNSSPEYDSRGKIKESFFAVEAGWTSRIARHFTNDFSAGFTPAAINDKSLYRYSGQGAPGEIMEQTTDGKNKFNNLLLSDHWTYHGRAGNWQIEPSVNLSFRNISVNNTGSIVTRNAATGNVVAVNTTSVKNKYNVLLLTPALNAVYKDRFSVQGGFVYNLSGNQEEGTPEATKLLPYISLGVDVLKNTRFDWKIFGSYATGGHLGDAAFPFCEAANNQITYPYPTRDYNYFVTIPVVYGGDSVNYALQAGTTIGWLNGRIQGSYNFEQRRYATLAYYLSFPSTIWLPVNRHHTIHRLGINARVFEGPVLSWQSGLNITAIKSKTELKTLTGPIVPVYGAYKKPLYTGGFTNRLQYKKFMAGLDLLYILNIGKYSGSTINNKQSALSFRNIYAGYQLQLKNKPLEVYLATRNPTQPDESMMPDKRMYYGAGFKWGL